MSFQTFPLLESFLFSVLHERVIAGCHVPEQVILPNQDPGRVTGMEEGIRRMEGLYQVRILHTMDNADILVIYRSRWN